MSGGESFQKLELSISDKVVGKNRYLSELQRSLGLFLLCFHCLNNITALCVMLSLLCPWSQQLCTGTVVYELCIMRNYQTTGNFSTNEFF